MRPLGRNKPGVKWETACTTATQWVVNEPVRQIYPTIRLIALPLVHLWRAWTVNYQGLCAARRWRILRSPWCPEQHQRLFLHEISWSSAVVTGIGLPLPREILETFNTILDHSQWKHGSTIITTNSDHQIAIAKQALWSIEIWQLQILIWQTKPLSSSILDLLYTPLNYHSCMICKYRTYLGNFKATIDGLLISMYQAVSAGHLRGPIKMSRTAPADSVKNVQRVGNLR